MTVELGSRIAARWTERHRAASCWSQPPPLMHYGARERQVGR